MALKSRHHVFFAVPFDSATLSMYREVGRRLRRADRDLITTIGTEEVGPSPRYAEIKSFRAQNADLVTRILTQIRTADIVVADLTNNNPNVHFELGIALALNKNILRVTGRNLTELGFDVRGLEVYQYGSGRALESRLKNYLNTFRTIKALPLGKSAGRLYRRITKTKVMSVNRPGGWDYERLPDTFRDGAIRFRAMFRAQQSLEDWYGVYCRASMIHPWLSSILVYARRNGWVEIATYPGTVVRARRRLFPRGIERETELMVEVEGDSIQVSAARGGVLRLGGLENQNVGVLGRGAWQSVVAWKRIEVVSRDTLDFG